MSRKLTPIEEVEGPGDAENDNESSANVIDDAASDDSVPERYDTLDAVNLRQKGQKPGLSRAQCNGICG